MNNNNNVGIRDFKPEEIAEINGYVITQIPQTILPQLFVLSEKLFKKAKVFVTIYRIMSGARDFSEKESTKQKIENHLNYVDDVYYKLYKIISKYDNLNINFGKNNLLRKLNNIVIENNYKINFFINSFLVFAEKQELISTDSVSGIKLENEEGMDIYNKLSKLVID